MKKLYRKGVVHPTPPPISDHLSFLPAAILTLAAALSPEEREVLAYLISCTSGNFSVNRRTTQKTNQTSGGGGDDHPPSFNCSCFRCYMSYWVKWDSSPNRQLIHEIIDEFEGGLLSAKNKRDKGKRERRKRGINGSSSSSSSAATDEMKMMMKKKTEPIIITRNELTDSDSVEESSGGGGEDDGEEEGIEVGSVRRIVSFLGERIWGVWGQG